MMHMTPTKQSLQQFGLGSFYVNLPSLDHIERFEVGSGKEDRLCSYAHSMKPSNSFIQICVATLNLFVEHLLGKLHAQIF